MKLNGPELALEFPEGRGLGSNQKNIIWEGTRLVYSASTQYYILNILKDWN